MSFNALYSSKSASGTSMAVLAGLLESEKKPVPNKPPLSPASFSNCSFAALRASEADLFDCSNSAFAIASKEFK